MPHLDTPHEAPRPIVGISDAIVVLQQHRQKYLAGGQGVGNVVPMAHEQVLELLAFLQTVERCVGATRFEAPDLWHVFAGQDEFRPTDERGKETVQLFQIHGAFAIRLEEQLLQAVKLLIGEPLRKGVHAMRWSELAGASPHTRLYLTTSLHVPALAQEIRPSQPSVLKGGLNT